MTSKQIEVSILGQPYRLACSPETEGALREAVARVDAEMTKVRTASSVRGTDRIAVMAALNLAHDLLRERRTAKTDSANTDGAVGGTPIDVDATRRRIQSMQSAIDQAMAGQDNLF